MMSELTPVKQEMALRPCTEADVASALGLYNCAIRTGEVTRHYQELSFVEFSEWLVEQTGEIVARVAVSDGRVLGFASLTRFHERAAYHTTEELTVIVDRG